MPLRDHFRPPLHPKHRWGSLHGGWPMMLVRDLFTILPAGYTANPNVQVGTHFEVDVGTTENDPPPYRDSADDGNEGSVATRVDVAPTLTVEADFSEDAYEVEIYDDQQRLVAAIEIVSPSNKDRPESREQFVSKVASLLGRACA